MRRRTCAFTLLELLVAVAIALGLAALMLAVVSGTLDQWRRTQDKFTTSAQAQQALDLMERDLHAAIFRPDGATWLALEVINDPSNLTTHGWLTATASKPSTAISRRMLPIEGGDTGLLLREARFGLSGVWLRCFTTNVEADASLPVAVSYQIARRPVSGAVSVTTGAEVRYTLFRSAVSATGTLAAGFDVTGSGYGSASVTPAGSRNARTLTNPNTADALATNVVDFGLWLYVRDPILGLRQIYPADTTDFTHAARSVGAVTDANRFPEVADVMVRVLTGEGAELVAALEAGTSPLVRPAEFVTDEEWWWAVVESHSDVHCRRIVLRGGTR